MIEKLKENRLYLGLFALTGLFSAFFHGIGLTKILPWNIVYSDLLGFFERATAAGFPYFDKPMEYPVLTGLFIQLMGFMGGSRAGYYFMSAAVLIILGLIATYFLLKTADEEAKKRIFQYWIFAPSIFMFSVFNWDMIAILSVILAFYFFSFGGKKEVVGVFFLALGFCAKFYPILYLVPFLIKKRSVEDWIKMLLVFAVTVLAVNVYFMFANFDGWSYFFTLNNARNSNPDSIWTIMRFAVYGFSVSQINNISLLLFGLSFGGVLWRFWKAPAILLCFIGTILFLLFNKVFSPQYILWLLPFFVLLPIDAKKSFYALEFSNLASFFIIIPWFFDHNLAHFYWSIPFVLLRHLALIIILLRALKLAKRYDFYL